MIVYIYIYTIELKNKYMRIYDKALEAFSVIENLGERILEQFQRG